jgi:unsaturated rhamnogalacturonyl hydrolase
MTAFLSLRNKRYRLLCALTAFLFTAAFATTAAADQTTAAKLCGYSPLEWSANVGTSTKQRRGDPLPFTVPNLVLAISLIELAERTDDPALRTYAEAIATRFVGADGSISVFPPAGFPVIETIPAGRIFVRMHERTGDERYRKAAAFILENFRTLPKTTDGVVAWRPGQIWLDGLWMALPFYAEYGRHFGEHKIFEDIRRQFAAATKHNGDPKTGLLYHGWDETREQFWANPRTGTSASLWARAMGWYAMALVDVLDDVPAEHAVRPDLMRLLDDISEALARYQDRQSGLWYQVIDQPTAAENYTEAGASAMFVYAIARGVNRGYLDRRFSMTAINGYKGLIRDKVDVDHPGGWVLRDIVRSAGLGAPPDWPPGSPPPSRRDAQPRGRDGSLRYYLEQPVLSDHSFGVGPFVRAGLEVEDLLKNAAFSEEALGFERLRCRN